MWRAVVRELLCGSTRAEVAHLSGLSVNRVTGPGAPEASYGVFAWVSDIRYLILPEWIISLFSLNLLKPEKTMASVALLPGFCPGYIQSNSDLFSYRLVDMYLQIRDAMENYPPNVETRKLPFGSDINLIPLEGAPKGFKLDLDTNSFALKQVMADDYPSMMMAFYVSVGLPLGVALVITIAGTIGVRKAMAAYRVRKSYEEAVLNDLATCIRLSQAGGMMRLTLLEVIEETATIKEEEMVNRTSAFYLVHAAFGMTDRTLDYTYSLVVVIRDLLFLAAPAVVPVYMGKLVKESLISSKCLVRLDKYVCEAEPEPVSMTALFLCLLYALTACAELSVHYLLLPYKRARRVLRHLYYFVTALMYFFSIFLLCSVGCWLVLGLLIDPPRLLPYVISVVSILAVALASWSQKVRLRVRAESNIRQRLKAFYENPPDEKLQGLPRIVFRTIVDQHLDNAIQNANLSTARVGAHTVAVVGFFLLQIYFLFLGFTAFSDPSSMSAACLNSALILALVAAHLAIFADSGDREGTKDAVDDLQVYNMCNVCNASSVCMPIVLTNLSISRTRWHRASSACSPSHQFKSRRPMPRCWKRRSASASGDEANARKERGAAATS